MNRVDTNTQGLPVLRDKTTGVHQEYAEPFRPFKLMKETFVREKRLALRNVHEMLNPLVFFLMVAALFPLGISPEATQLRMIAPGVVWVAALLATLLALQGLFRSDYEDGSLEQMLLSSQPLFLIVMAKVCVYWLLTGLPLTLSAPLIGMMLFLPLEGMTGLLLSLLLGTPTLIFVGAIGAALTVGIKQGGVLVSLLVLPLYIPVLIFGTAAIDATLAGQSIAGHLAILGAFLALSVSLAPIAISAALKISLT